MGPIGPNSADGSQARCFGLEAYKDLWRQEVVGAESKRPLAKVVREWSRVNEAFKLRGALIHGNNTCTEKTATPHVEVLIRASGDIASYCESQGIDLHSRLKVRRRRTHNPSRQRIKRG